MGRWGCSVSQLVGHLVTRWIAVQADAVRVLLKLGAEVDAVNDKGYSALHEACSQGSVECIMELGRARPRLLTPRAYAWLPEAAAALATVRCEL